MSSLLQHSFWIFLFCNTFGIQKSINESLNDAIGGSAYWGLSVPLSETKDYCSDYWGRKSYRRGTNCLYFFHSKVNSLNVTAEHFVSADQEISSLIDKARENKWDVEDIIHKCIAKPCHGTRPWFGSKYFINATGHYFEYFTVYCCPSPTCYQDPSTLQEALYYPQNILGQKIFNNQKETEEFLVDLCPSDPQRPKFYYLGSQKPLSSGTDEKVLVTFGQDSPTCDLGTQSTASVQITDCKENLTGTSRVEKCFSLCLTAAFDSNTEGLWAVDSMLLKLLENAAKRERTHCAAYSFQNDTCTILREAATGDFLSDDHQPNITTSFFESEESTNKGKYSYACALVTTRILNPIIRCDCRFESPTNHAVSYQPCDARMYARENKMFTNMYAGKWNYVTSDNSPTFEISTPSCPDAKNALVFMCEIDFIYENGVMKITTLPVTFGRLIQIQDFMFNGYENGQYYCAEESTTTRIICVCEVAYQSTPIQPCTETMNFTEAKTLAKNKAGYSVAELSTFSEELQRCVHSPTNENRQDVLDYKANFLCYYVHRTSNVGIGRLIDQGIFTKNSPPPQLPIVRVLCDRQKITSTHLITRGCLCGYYFYRSSYRFLVCCCFPRAFTNEFDRSQKLNLV